jgi:hypothetical protein
MVLLALLIATSVAGQSLPDRTPLVVSGSGAPPVSARAVASWYYEHVTSEAPRLLFLVLYRGQPDWHRRDAAANRHGARAGSRTSPGGRIDLGPLEVRHIVGGIDLGITVDAAREVLRVLGQELSLTEHNVFLIDCVDGLGGVPVVVNRLKVDLDPALDFSRPDRPDVAGLINRVPALQDFVGSP